jgi:hypothetical protein
LNECFSFVEDLEVECDANECQQEIPRLNDQQMSQIDGTVVNGSVSGPKWARKNDERHNERKRNQSDNTTIGDFVLVPFVANDGQVAVNGS